MRKYLHLIVIALLHTLSSQVAQAQEANDQDGDVRYIIDDLYTYMHAGPGRNYRILGSVVAGSRVIQLQIDSDSGYVEVIDDRQRTGWVDAKFVTEKSTVRALVPDLRQDIEQTGRNLLEQQTLNDQLNQQIANMSAQTKELNNQLTALRETNSTLRKELAQRDDSAQMEWFTRGGILALISIVVGILLTYLPKKKRRNDQWM